MIKIKILVTLSLAFFVIVAMIGEPKKGQLSPEKEAFLNARYEEFKKSCAQKDARACKRVILFYQKQAKKQNEKDIREAMQILLGACKDGKFDACAAAGEMHINNKDFIATREILSPACDSGYRMLACSTARALRLTARPVRMKNARKSYTKPHAKRARR